MFLISIHILQLAVLYIWAKLVIQLEISREMSYYTKSRRILFNQVIDLPCHEMVKSQSKCEFWLQKRLWKTCEFGILTHLLWLQYLSWFLTIYKEYFWWLRIITPAFLYRDVELHIALPRTIIKKTVRIASLWNSQGQWQCQKKECNSNFK